MYRVKEEQDNKDNEALEKVVNNVYFDQETGARDILEEQDIVKFSNNYNRILFI